MLNDKGRGRHSYDGTPPANPFTMKFNNGYFGACICVLALLGTASCGFFLNIEKDTREVTNYEFTADVSGLFSYTDAPEYIDYNPSSNLNGYDGNVVYTPSNVVNNYRYKIADGTSVSLTCPSITNSDTNPVDYGPFQTNQLVKMSSTPYQHDFLLGAVNQKMGGMKFSDYLNNLSISDYEIVTLNLTYSDPYPVFFYPDGWIFDTYTIPVNPYTIERWTSDTPLSFERNTPSKLVIQTASNLVSAYNGDNLLWSKTADNVGVFAWYIADGGNQYQTTRVDISGVGTTLPTYGYMNPNAGVKATTTEATWSNGYHNNTIDIKVIKNGDNNTWPHTLQFTIGTSTVNTVYTGSGFRVGVNNISPFTDIGNWLGVQIRLNGSDGSVIFTPTNDLDLLSTVEPTDYSLTFENVFTPGDIDSFKVKTLANSSKFQVTSTKVFLNTYNTVMIDPSINVGDYFPNYDEYRLNFYSFAILGDSITINGQTCPVNKENGTITFRNAADFEFTKTLANIYLTFQDGHTYLTFVNDSSVYDLGETVNSVVSFSGMWYFTTGLYKAVDGVETFWNLDLDGMFHATAGECLIMFIGIIGLGTIVYTVWGRGKLGTYDWIVIIFSIFLGSCLLGF